RDQRAVRAAAQTFRANPRLDTEKAIGELAVGEALVSLLESGGTPGIVQRAWIAPPASRHGPLSPEERKAVIASSPLAGRYDVAVDRPSAYEHLRGETKAADPEVPPPSAPWGGRPTVWKPAPAPPPPAKPEPAPRVRQRAPAAPAPPAGSRGRQTMGEAVAKSIARSIASSIGSRIGREIVRGVLGSIVGGRKR
ncbi:MAG: DUF853 family protein, partial [Rhodospirillales bacterium]|nr:DUF853 family protein [Rhodospirillales bacterium]